MQRNECIESSFYVPHNSRVNSWAIRKSQITVNSRYSPDILN